MTTKCNRVINILERKEFEKVDFKKAAGWFPQSGEARDKSRSSLGIQRTVNVILVAGHPLQSCLDAALKHLQLLIEDARTERGSGDGRETEWIDQI